MLMLLFHSLWKNKSLIRPALLQASACGPSQSRRGLGSSLWEHEKSTDVLGSQFTASGLILVGSLTNFKSQPKQCLIPGRLPVLQTSKQLLVWEEHDLHLEMHFLLWEISGQCGMKKISLFLNTVDVRSQAQHLKMQRLIMHEATLTRLFSRKLKNHRKF